MRWKPSTRLPPCIGPPLPVNAFTTSAIKRLQWSSSSWMQLRVELKLSMCNKMSVWLRVATSWVQESHAKLLLQVASRTSAYWRTHDVGWRMRDGNVGTTMQYKWSEFGVNTKKEWFISRDLLVYAGISSHTNFLTQDPFPRLFKSGHTAYEHVDKSPCVQAIEPQFF